MLASPSRRGVFADHALELLSHGLAVLPADGKVPLVRNWNCWKRPPSVRAIERFAQQFPAANVAILPGLSRLLVADIDSSDQANEVERLLGKTPLRVTTSRGRHLYYRHAGDTSQLPSTLQEYGLNVDLKAGYSIVIAPPSRHPDGTVYKHHDCDWRDLKRLPEANLKILLKTSTVGRKYERFSEGHRGLGLNNLLCRHAAYVDTFDDLLDVARTANDDFLPPLPDNEVVGRTKAVWKDLQGGKLGPWIGDRAVARTNVEEIKKLCAMERNGSDAVTLLMLLRAHHSARCARGETFAIAAQAMQRAAVIPGWHWKRIIAARNTLLNGGHIQLVCQSRPTRSGRLPAQYTLAQN